MNEIDPHAEWHALVMGLLDDDLAGPWRGTRWERCPEARELMAAQELRHLRGLIDRMDRLEKRLGRTPMRQTENAGFMSWEQVGEMLAQGSPGSSSDALLRAFAEGLAGLRSAPSDPKRA